MYEKIQFIIGHCKKYKRGILWTILAVLLFLMGYFVGKCINFIWYHNDSCPDTEGEMYEHYPDS